jgi:predicted phosphoribosyltransferase
MVFESRTSAGKLLGVELARKKYANPHIFALVRGGVPVAAEVSKVLMAPLDAVVVRKLGLPSFPELGFGAIAPGGVVEIDDTIVNRYHLHVDDIKTVQMAEECELDRRIQKYGAYSTGDLIGQTAILIDDGIATGASMLVAVRYMKKFNPAKIVVAVPVCPDTAENQFLGVADEFVCLDFEEYFGVVGEFYEQFPQVTDKEVVSLLKNY